MEYELNKEVLNLRKFLFEEFFEMQEEDKEFLTDDKMVSIDSIIALLSTYDYTIDKVEDEVREIDEMSYYDLIELNEMKDDALKHAKKLRNEIIKKFYDSKNINSINDLTFELDDGKNCELKYTTNLKGKIKTLSRECSNLKEILEKEKYKANNINKLSLIIEDMYKKIDDIYNNIKNYNELYDDFEDEDINNDFEYEELDDEFYDSLNSQWTNSGMFNYDIASIDCIYLTIFGEIEEQQRILIGLMLADFYEYHKVKKLFEFKEEENTDILETIDFIENSSLDENIQRFLNEPIWASYIIDSYIYYNVNNTPYDKLSNRMAISELNKLDILKRYNPYINDSLKDSTLYNLFITPISDLIRNTNYNLTIDIESNDKQSIDRLLVKYFTTSFLPEKDSYIPKQLKRAKINDLKKLQLKFLISDFIERHIHENNEFINSLLNMDEETLYNYIKSNPLILNGITKEYLSQISDETKTKLSSKEKQKILSINKLTMLDT